MQAGLLQTYNNSAQRRGAGAWIIASLLFAFYILIYFTEAFTPVAHAIGLSGKWNLYGILYTIAILSGGLYFFKRHGNSRYHRYRTISVMLVQTVFAFSIPWFMELMQTRGFIFSLFWPLKIDYFYPSYIMEYPLPVILYAILGSLIIVPIATFLFGKRWYCSWVCGCGGLAETAGEPFRHLSNKKPGAWKFEQISIHTVMLLALITSAIVLINWGLGKEVNGVMVPMYPAFSTVVFKIQGIYSFFVVALLSGVFGVALYPILGSRVWCRFFCPLAAYMGLIQKLGRFRVTVKDDMCISCGNCSTYCEMGIDVRMYAQNNIDVKRASCVGCGMCAHVCPRGVLKLENKWDPNPMAEESKIKVFDL
ncbi:MAG: 4Fe-4S binding protein [candidate division Zixibacteria bacterium]|nr:4Fe-4S binding protein [candidate division Zixibacteria bacterium]